jgi:hypothetical protein
MTWRAIKNALAGPLAGLAGGVLLGAPPAPATAASWPS